MYSNHKKLRDALDDLSNRCLTIRNRSLARTVANEYVNSSKMLTRVLRLDEHLSKDCRYNPFRLVNTSGEDKSRLSSFFISIQDKSRYEASDMSGTYGLQENLGRRLIYDGEQFEDRYQLRVTRLHAQQCAPLWREQFDHAAKDYLSSLHHADSEHFVKSLCNKSWTKIQKWWEIFGNYWLISNCHNNDDIKLMSWLMNGANHGIVSGYMWQKCESHDSFNL